MTLNSEQRYIPDFVYWTVYDEKGNKYADCGWEKDAQRICELHEGEGFTYRHASELQQPEL